MWGGENGDGKRPGLDVNEWVKKAKGNVQHFPQILFVPCSPYRHCVFSQSHSSRAPGPPGVFFRLLTGSSPPVLSALWVAFLHEILTLMD
jgi:hypothetical protein